MKRFKVAAVFVAGMTTLVIGLVAYLETGMSYERMMRAQVLDTASSTASTTPDTTQTTYPYPYEQYFTTAQDTAVSCPFTTYVQPGDILIDFTHGGSARVSQLVLSANRTQVEARRTLTSATTIPVGSYQVKMASLAPGYTGGLYTKQQWYLSADDPSGNIIGRTDATQDITTTTASPVIDPFVQTVKVDAAVTSVTAHHAAYPSNTSELVVPLCVMYRPIVTGTGGTAATTTQTTPTVLQVPAHACPFVPRTGRIIVDFTNGASVPVDSIVVLGNGTGRMELAASTSIAAGTYTVKLASFNTKPDGSWEPLQAWQAIVRTDNTGAHSSFLQPPATAVGMIYSNAVGTITLPVAATQVIGRHVTSSTASPVGVLCGAFDLVTTTSPAQTYIVPTDTKLVTPAAAETATNTTSTTTVTPHEEPVPAENVQIPVQPIPVTMQTGTTPQPEPTHEYTKPTVQPTAVVPKTQVVPKKPLAATSSGATHEESSADLGLVGPSRVITVPEHVVTQRKVIMGAVGGSPFDRLQHASPAEREVIVRDMIQLVRASSTATSGTSAAPLSIAVRVSNETATSTAATSSVETPRSLAERAGLSLLLDQDADGISDYDEENLYHTDKFNPFSGGSVLSDGERLLLGLDPHSNSLTPVVTESPRTAPQIERLFSVSDIALVTAPSSATTSESRKIHIRGTAPQHAFVTLYVYSTPIIVTVRTDTWGSFDYELDAQLADGSHELFVASVNDTGKVLATSAPIPFVKTAEAISYTPEAHVSSEDPVSAALLNTLPLVVVIALLTVMSVVVLIGYLRSRRGTTDTGTIAS